MTPAPDAVTFCAPAPRTARVACVPPRLIPSVLVDLSVMDPYVVAAVAPVVPAVGVVTTILYWMAIVTNQDTQIIGSTWSNMFSVLLTNAFSIVGTIMGIKYATQEGSKEKK